jgi:membrane protein insertase Oxa1/YidC/SpoIIIJ
MRARRMNTVLHSSRSPDSVWWGRVRFVLGMAQMAASVAAVVLLFGVGVAAISLTAVVVASLLTSLSVMLFGSRRNRRETACETRLCCGVMCGRLGLRGFG